MTWIPRLTVAVVILLACVLDVLAQAPTCESTLAAFEQYAPLVKSSRDELEGRLAREAAAALAWKKRAEAAEAKLKAAEKKPEPVK